MTISGPVWAIHWLTAIGALLLTVGSLLQARNEIGTYRAELKESGLEDAFRAILDVSQDTITISTPGIIGVDPFTLMAQMIKLIRLVVKVNKNISGMRKEGGEKAIRIGELLNKGLVWLIIMYGGIAVVVGAGIQLAVDYLG